MFAQCIQFSTWRKHILENINGHHLIFFSLNMLNVYSCILQEIVGERTIVNETYYWNALVFRVLFSFFSLSLYFSLEMCLLQCIKFILITRSSSVNPHPTFIICSQMGNFPFRIFCYINAIFRKIKNHFL